MTAPVIARLAGVLPFDQLLEAVDDPPPTCITGIQLTGSGVTAGSASVGHGAVKIADVPHHVLRQLVDPLGLVHFADPNAIVLDDPTRPYARTSESAVAAMVALTGEHAAISPEVARQHAGHVRAPNREEVVAALVIGGLTRLRFTRTGTAEIYGAIGVLVAVPMSVMVEQVLVRNDWELLPFRSSARRTRCSSRAKHPARSLDPTAPRGVFSRNRPPVWSDNAVVKPNPRGRAAWLMAAPIAAAFGWVELDESRSNSLKWRRWQARRSIADRSL